MPQAILLADHENLGALFRNAAAFGVDGGLLDHVRTAGAHFERQLRSLALKHPLIVETRGAGLMRGVELRVDAQPVVDLARHAGLLVAAASGSPPGALRAAARSGHGASVSHTSTPGSRSANRSTVVSASSNGMLSNGFHFLPSGTRSCVALARRSSIISTNIWNASDLYSRSGSFCPQARY